MATTTTKPEVDGTAAFPSGVPGVSVPAWPRSEAAGGMFDSSSEESDTASPRNALHALLAFAALHDQVRRRKSLAARHNGFEPGSPAAEFEKDEQFVLNEVLQLVAERAVAITGADGLAIALAENDAIVLRAAAGSVRPDVGARIDRDSAFSGACFRTAQIVTCDDTETDPRVQVDACRKLGARSMVAVPLCGRRRVIGVLEAFFAWPFGFNDSDIRNLSLLAELVLGALKPEDEDRFAQSAESASRKLQSPVRLATATELPSIPPAAKASSTSAPAAPYQSAVSASHPVLDKKLDAKQNEAKETETQKKEGKGDKKDGAKALEAKVVSSPPAATTLTGVLE